MKTRALVILFFGLFQTLTAYADTDANLERLLSLNLEELMQIKINIATDTKQALSKAPSVVTVITAEDIKATGTTNLTDILQSVPGVYVKDNLFGLRPLVTFRGADSSHTLLMVNGIPMRDLVWDPGIFWRGLPTSMIERVEIIRGPGSALFGSDASAGVINVITKTAVGIDKSEAGVRAGSFNTQEGWMQHGGNWNGLDVGFTAELMHTDGSNPFIAKDANGASGYAQYGHDNADLRLSVAKDNWRMLADYTNQSNIKTGLSGGGVLDPLTNGETSKFNIQQLYSNENFAKDWGLNAEIHYFHLDYSSGDGFQNEPPGYTNTKTGVTYPDGMIDQYRSAEHGYDYEVSGLYTGLKAHAIRVGGGYNSEDLYFVQQLTNYAQTLNNQGKVQITGSVPLTDISNSPYVFSPEKTRNISYAFLQDVWTLAHDWELTAGARYDHYSDFGGTVNPRLALVWQSTDRLTTKLMYGQAFRAPSFLQLYALTTANTPNPNLKPEQSQTTDLSFSYLASKDVKLGLDLYQFDESNLIAADSTPLAQFQNTGSNTSRGVELEAMWQATKLLRVSGNFSDRNDSTPYNAVPKQKAYLRTDLAFMPNWNWNTQANWIGAHSIAPGDPRAPIDAYTLVDTTIRYSHLRDWEFAGSIRNLFNTDVRELTSKAIPNDLPLPSRNLYAEMRYKF
jgi:outer membrane receptor protein involved in Fe transport